MLAPRQDHLTRKLINTNTQTQSATPRIRRASLPRTKRVVAAVAAFKELDEAELHLADVLEGAADATPSVRDRAEADDDVRRGEGWVSEAKLQLVRAFAQEIVSLGHRAYVQVDSFPDGTEASLRIDTIGLDVIDADAHQLHAILRAEGRHQESPDSEAIPVSRTYLVGVGEEGLTVSPIRDHLTTVAEACTALLPDEARGREHLRQGDVHLIRSDQTTPSGVVASVHLWDAARRILTHSPLSGRRLTAVVVPRSWAGVEVIVRRGPGMQD